MLIAADEDCAAAGLTAGIDYGVTREGHARAENFDVTARATRGTRHAPLPQHRIAASLEYNLPILTRHSAVRADGAELLDKRAIHTDAPARCHDLADVKRPVTRRADNHAHIGIVRIREIDTLTGRPA